METITIELKSGERLVIENKSDTSKFVEVPANIAYTITPPNETSAKIELENRVRAAESVA